MAGVVLEQLGDPGDVDGLGDAGGLAVVQRLELGQLGGVLVDGLTDPVQQTLPLRGRPQRPRAGERPPGGDGPVDVLRTAVRHVDQLLGGYKESGWGRELGASAIDAYTEQKTVNVLL